MLHRNSGEGTTLKFTEVNVEHKPASSAPVRCHALPGLSVKLMRPSVADNAPAWGWTGWSA